MSSNSKRYIELCAANNYIRKEHNLQDVESIKASCARNVSLGDCLPLALECTIIIYSNDIRTPVYDIIPSTKITGKKSQPEKSVDLSAMKMFQMKADKVLCHFTTLYDHMRGNETLSAT
jgi:hypothetical protein